ncbi:ribbon-helix-helix protein, CopG family [Methylobacterium sp. 285MFTsu5.1]|nr:ribbon-helix-helix protein, CopG family [Methylobacterium sp. 285MFTsu5.1]
MQVQLRLTAEQAAALDALRSEDGSDGQHRSEAIRQILTEHLKTKGYLK